MGTFDYNSFADLTHVFDLKKGQAVPPRPKARVILYSSTFLKSRNLQSRFFETKSFIPEAKQPFRSVSKPKTKPTQKARPILRLKKKVDIALVTPLTRRSSAEELAAVFKAEMALMQKQAKTKQAENTSLEDAFTQRRRHPLSNKPWSELLAIVEQPEKRKNFDIAAAFKAEMKAFMAEQEKIGASGTMETVISPAKFKLTSERKQAVRQMRPAMAA